MNGLDSCDRTEPKIDKVLPIGVTGGTGANVVKGFLEQGVTNLRAITRKIDLERPSLAKMSEVGVELVEANLDEEFPGLLTTFEEFLEGTNWANPQLTYDSL